MIRDTKFSFLFLYYCYGNYLFVLSYKLVYLNISSPTISRHWPKKLPRLFLFHPIRKCAVVNAIKMAEFSSVLEKKALKHKLQFRCFVRDDER